MPSDAVADALDSAWVTVCEGDGVPVDAVADPLESAWDIACEGINVPPEAAEEDPVSVTSVAITGVYAKTTSPVPPILEPLLELPPPPAPGHALRLEPFALGKLLPPVPPPIW